MKLWKDGKPTLLLAIALCAVLALLLFGGGTETDSADRQEKRMAQVLGAISGAGKVEVALFYGQESEGLMGAQAQSRPIGAVVVAEGGGDMSVRLSLIRAVRTLLGLPESAVDVFEMEENGR